MLCKAQVTSSPGLVTSRNLIHTPAVYRLRQSHIAKAIEPREEEDVIASISSSDVEFTPRSVDAKPLTPESIKDLVDELLDTSQLGKRGEAWFLAQGVLILLVLFPTEGFRRIADTIGGIGIIVGLTMIVLGSIALGQNLTPLPQPRDDHSLVTNGIYEVIRHPMYGGLIVSAAGLALSAGDEARLLLTALLFVVLNAKATYEEELLVERYGNQYKTYQKKSKKLIPWLW